MWNTYLVLGLFVLFVLYLFMNKCGCRRVEGMIDTKLGQNDNPNDGAKCQCIKEPFQMHNWQGELKWACVDPSFPSVRLESECTDNNNKAKSDCNSDFCKWTPPPLKPKEPPYSCIKNRPYRRTIAPPGLSGIPCARGKERCLDTQLGWVCKTTDECEGENLIVCPPPPPPPPKTHCSPPAKPCHDHPDRCCTDGDGTVANSNATVGSPPEKIYPQPPWLKAINNCMGKATKNPDSCIDKLCFDPLNRVCNNVGMKEYHDNDLEGAYHKCINSGAENYKFHWCGEIPET